MFETAMWITAGEDFKESLPSFQKKWRAKGKVKKATAYMTAYGVYNFYIDGKKVGNRLMAPGWTFYEKWIQYQTYDITDLLAEESTLSVVLAPGWACGYIGWDRYKFDPYPGPYSCRIPSVVATFVFEYDDGTTETVHTDETWDVFTSQILFCELYDGEVSDFTAAPRFVGKAMATPQPVPNVLPQIGEDVVERETVLPVSLFTTPKGEKVIDFGQNLAGYVRFKAKGKPGDKVRFSYAEVLDKEGNFYTENYRTAKNETIYILDGQERVLQPNLTFQGFRYIRIDEFPEEVKKENFCAVAIYSDMTRVGDFSCGNEKLNQLYSNVLWGQRGNYIDIPTDCPQRDERMGWTGDAQVFCRTAALNYDVQKFFRKWLYDMTQNQREDGSIPVIVPSFGNVKGTATAWSDAATVCPWEMYRAYGDKDDLRSCYDMMKKWVEFMHNFGEDEFLYVGGKHYGDWVALDAGEGKMKGATQTDLIASAYFAYSTALTIKAGKVLGEDTTQLEELYRNVRKAFREAFMENGMPKIYPKGDGLSVKRTVKGVTQTSLAIILCFGLYEPEERQGLVDKLVQLIEDFGGRMNSGFVGTPLLLHALSDHGRADVAFDLLLQEESPSWLFSVNQGATTIWEHWDGIKDDGSFWDEKMNSFNHYAYGSVYDWMFGDMVGITVCDEGAGYKKITYAPHTDKRIGFAKGSLETRQGRAAASWRYLPDGSIQYELTLPADTTAEVRIPGLPQRTVTGGSYVFYTKA